jgi:hypothetical protein
MEEKIGKKHSEGEKTKAMEWKPQKNSIGNVRRTIIRHNP